ncbi:MAG: hypothetical protein ACTTJ6_05550 [Treponema sp.]
MKCTFCGEENDCFTLDKCKLFFYQTVHVCKECSKKYGLEELLALKANREVIHEAKKPIYCPTCNTTLFEIIKNNELGCADCFYTFKEKIVNILWKKLPNIGYTGEHKKTKQENQNKNILKDKLQKLLDQALEIEDYEAALYFSKEIKKIGKI